MYLSKLWNVFVKIYRKINQVFTLCSFSPFSFKVQKIFLWNACSYQTGGISLFCKMENQYFVKCTFLGFWKDCLFSLCEHCLKYCQNWILNFLQGRNQTVVDTIIWFPSQSEIGILSLALSPHILRHKTLQKWCLWLSYKN